MAKKRIEDKLTNLLKNFDEEYIFYTPKEEEFLSKIFKNASKKGAGRGIPDRIFYNGEVLIIFECKVHKLEDAIKDLKIYKKKIELLIDSLDVYFVAFVKDIYKIYDFNFNEIKKLLVPNNI